MTQAIERGRSGKGPSVVECVTYRMGHHTTADDATRYRSKEEVETWKAKDPVARLRRHLLKTGLLTEAETATIQTEAEELVAAELKAYEATPPPNPLDMFANNYEKAPWHVIEQRAELAEVLKEKQGRNEIPELPAAEGRFP